MRFLSRFCVRRNLARDVGTVSEIHEGTRVPIGVAAKVSAAILGCLLPVGIAYMNLAKADNQTNARIDRLELTTDLTLKRDVSEVKLAVGEIKALLADIKDGMNEQTEINRRLGGHIDELRATRRRSAPPNQPSDNP